jgi:pimeloyl-ACP methyl ester carboxylesterase
VTDAPGAREMASPEGGRVEYLDFGEGPPFVVVLGATEGIQTVGQMARGIRHLFRRRAADFRVIVVGRPEPIPCDGEPRCLAGDLAAALDALGVGPAVVEGISAGGPVAAWLALDRPDLVSRLVLTVTFARADAHLRRVLERWIDLAEEGRWLDLVLDSLRRGRPRAQPVPDGQPAPLASLRLAFAPPSAERFVRISRGLLDTDLTPLLPSVRQPTLVVGGALDAINPPSLVEELAAGIPDARLLMLPDQGHNLYEASDEYRAAVEQFASP